MLRYTVPEKMYFDLILIIMISILQINRGRDCFLCPTMAMILIEVMLMSVLLSETTT